MNNDDATMAVQSAKEFAMRCTAMVLSVMVFTSACRAADAPPSVAQSSTPPPASQPGSRWAPQQHNESPPAPRGRSASMRGGVVTVDGGDQNNPWVMIRPKATSRPTEKGAYLGLAVSSVPTVVRDQLKLQKNVGLVVNFVEKDSPAEASGFKPSDILQKLDDQILIDTRQFAVLVRIHDVSQPIRFTIIREARPMEITAKLVEKDLAVLDESGRGGSSLDGPFERYMEMQAEQRTREAMDRANDQVRRANEQAGRAIEQLRRRMESANAFGLESNDGQHTFKISDTNGRRTLKASDKSGKMIYDGPIETEEEMDQLPAEIKEKVKKLPMVWTLRGGSTTQPAFPALPALPADPAVPAIPAKQAPPAPPAPASVKPPPSPTAAASEQPTY